MIVVTLGTSTLWAKFSRNNNFKDELGDFHYVNCLRVIEPQVFSQIFPNLNPKKLGVQK